MNFFSFSCAALALVLATSLVDALGSRVIDGETAERGQFPYQVTLTEKLLVLCGGVLVHERFFLTAAHCLFDANNTLLPLNNLNVYYGSEKLFSNGKYNRIRSVLVHDQYEHGSTQYDLALVEVRRSLELSFNTQPVALAESALEEQQAVTVSGFGRTSEAGNTSFKLKHAELTTLSSGDCQEATGDGWYEGAICLDTSNGGGFCTGDYGGPAVFNGTLVGVGSYTVGGRCGTGQPDVFVDVGHFSGWVKAQIDEKESE
ncbi:serine protease SP24D-like [Anopheles aquasalis]|uniref:serine protease SP24D-like n=1 Tax=Anopheles aquasalis TaxID=42839 RepID=UPI00215A6C62|nr:serine protease SP24D-like [Anopheles aquasalis]